jgi:hypothetical protein
MKDEESLGAQIEEAIFHLSLSFLIFHYRLSLACSGGTMRSMANEK